MSSNFPITNDNTIDEEEKWRTGGGGGAGSDAGGGACGGADRLPVAGEGRGRRRGRRRRHRRRRRQVVVGHGPRAAASAWPKKKQQNKRKQNTVNIPFRFRCSLECGWFTRSSVATTTLVMFWNTLHPQSLAGRVPVSQFQPIAVAIFVVFFPRQVWCTKHVQNYGT